MTGPFRILLHAPFYASLRKQPAESRQRFHRVLERLSAGRWDGGTRVKKLQGVPKPVFEARHDAGDRVLFTLARSAAPDDAPVPGTASPLGGPGPLGTYIQVWDLVPHDRVTQRAARLNRSAEAEFLDYRELESELITSPPPHPAAAFADVPRSEPGVEPGVLELMLAPPDSPSSDREEIAGGVRWLVVPERLLAREEEWQSLMDRGAEELELKLTAEQYAVVRAPGPVLLTGSAGSGKTTIAVHRLAAAACPPAGTHTLGSARTPAGPRTLYLTYSPWLLDHARRLFRDVLLCRGQTPTAPPHFLTVDDLYRALVEGSGGRPPERLAGFAEFTAWLRRHLRGASGPDPALAWEEIRSIVKGACLDPRRFMLHRGEYEGLGRKRAPIFSGEREILYPIARKWQKHLEESRRLDEIDLCRQALAAVRPQDAYDHIICDEAQDLAEIQVHLLLRLHRGGTFGGLFLAGDPQQVINPSGFRWGEVRTAIRASFQDRARPAPGLHALTRNFRSVRPLVELANAVLALKRERTGRSEGDEAEESTVVGSPPVRVAGTEAELAAAAADFGPRCAVIAGSAGQRDRLRARLETTRIFTAAEAKGLEFDVVILWGFLAAEPGPWRCLLDPSADLKENPACRRALHHLYVALTRARRHLAVYEPDDAPPLWASPRFAPLLEPGIPETLARLFARSAAPEEWLREGEYFLERQRHRQAAECFRRAGEARRETECLAHHHEAAGEPMRAAELWSKLGERSRAAACYQQAGRFRQAARLWQELGEVDSAERCKVHAAEADRRWKPAAESWEKLGDWEAAARCWSHAGQRSRQLACLARAAQAAGRHADAARHWEEMGARAEAAAAWRRAGREGEATLAEAADHEAHRRWAEAAAAWEKAGEHARARRCHAEHAVRGRRWADAARLWEELGDFERAGRCWKSAGETSEARRCRARAHLAGGRFLKAAEVLEHLQEFEAAAEAWQKAEEAGQQPRHPRPLSLPEAAADGWAHGASAAQILIHPRYDPRTGRLLPEPVWSSRLRGLACTLRAAEESGDYELAARVWSRLGDPGQALRCRVTALRAAGTPEKAAALLELEGLLPAARTAFRDLGLQHDADRCEAAILERRGRLAEARRIFERLGNTVGAHRCRGKLHLKLQEYAAAAAAFEAAGEKKAALDARLLDLQLHGDMERAVKLLQAHGRKRAAERILRRPTAWLKKASRMAAEARRREQRRQRRLNKMAEPQQADLFPAAGEQRRRRSRPASRAGSARPAGEGPRGVRSPPAVGNLPPGAGRRMGIEALQRVTMAMAATEAPAGPPPSLLDPAALERWVQALIDTGVGPTCADLEALTGVYTYNLGPILKRLYRQGRIAKTGRTRGMRYWPAE